jgi:hypothetical protein
MLLKNGAKRTLLQDTLVLKVSNKELLRENSTSYEIRILVGHGGVNSLWATCIIAILLRHTKMVADRQPRFLARLRQLRRPPLGGPAAGAVATTESGRQLPRSGRSGVSRTRGPAARTRSWCRLRWPELRCRREPTRRSERIRWSSWPFSRKFVNTIVASD